jgi:hypothetical protein
LTAVVVVLAGTVVVTWDGTVVALVVPTEVVEETTAVVVE